MSGPAFFALIRDGQTQYYGDRWASIYLHRELVWGLEALLAWIANLEEVDELGDDFSEGVVIDVDHRKLSLFMDSTELAIPKAAALYNRLLTTAWPGYEIHWCYSSAELFPLLGMYDPDAELDDERARLEDRVSDIRSAAGLDGEDDDEDEDEDADEDEDEDEHEIDEDRHANKTSSGGSKSSTDAEPDFEESYSFDDDELRAWVTITDSNGSIRHRELIELPHELLQCKPTALEELVALPSCEVPNEDVVKEGMWIDVNERTIGVWGGPLTEAALPVVESAWRGWDVQWAARGYVQHCAATGPSGTVLKPEQALARFIPTILSTERVSMDRVFSAIGTSLRRTAIKGTGCLLFVICLPVLIFGAVSGNWRAVLITVGITVALVVAVFMILDASVRKKFRNAIQRDDDQLVGKAPAAGPLDKAQRREALDKLLSAAGLPSISKIEPHFPALNAFGMPE